MQFRPGRLRSLDQPKFSADAAVKDSTDVSSGPSVAPLSQPVWNQFLVCEADQAWSDLTAIGQPPLINTMTSMARPLLCNSLRSFCLAALIGSLLFIVLLTRFVLGEYSSSSAHRSLVLRRSVCIRARPLSYYWFERLRNNLNKLNKSKGSNFGKRNTCWRLL